MKIIVELTDEQQWTITCGDKSSDRMTWDEMMGLLSSLTMPQQRPCLQWMRTEAERKQHEAIYNAKEDVPKYENELPFDI